MDTIEKRIHEHFASLPEESTVTPEPAVRDGPPAAALRDYVAPATLMEAFAKVNTVADGGPAAAAGLKPGDEIRAFGYVNASNHDDLKKVAECVRGNEGVSRNPCTFTKSIANSSQANHPGKGFEKDRRWRPRRTPTILETDEQLGWKRFAGVSYNPNVIHQPIEPRQRSVNSCISIVKEALPQEPEAIISEEKNIPIDANRPVSVVVSGRR